MIHGCDSRQEGGGEVTASNLVGVCDTILKTLTLSKGKTNDLISPIFDLTENVTPPLDLSSTLIVFAP